jgi:predicted TIM-barrel fold metal-dependent hydrolase
MSVSKYTGPVIDTDIHYRPPFDADYLEFYPERTRAYAEAAVAAKIPFRSVRTSRRSEHGGRRADTWPEDGGMAGSSFELLRTQALDEWGVYRAVLTLDDPVASHLNPYFTSDLCRATNDWTIEHWLARDERLYAGILVAPSLPEEAVAEIYRLADSPQMAYISLSGSPLHHPIGHPLYHPIYAAAVDVGLPIASHVNAVDFGQLGAPGGKPGTMVEFGAALGFPAAHYVSSFIVHGVFEKFPALKVLLMEYALSWLPGLLWDLERDYDLLRLESPWVKRRPTEYVHEHFKFTTQPLETGRPSESERLVQLLEVVDGMEDLLCFSSDYPHFTMDDRAFVARVLPRAWHRKLYCDNACELFNWTPPPTESPARGEAKVTTA